MIVFIENHPYGYELQRVTQLFCFGEKVEVQTGKPDSNIPGNWVHTCLEGNCLAVSACYLGKVRQMQEFVSGNLPPSEIESRFGVLIYRLLSAATGLCPPWGVLTGIRPVKLFLSRMRDGMDVAALERYFVGERLVSPERFQLAVQTAQIEKPLLERASPHSYSLYVSIPFCPTRCAYCSFVSHSVQQSFKLIPGYLENLCEELRETARITSRLGLRLQTVYFGGGTPTSLEADQLALILDTIANSFDLSGIEEYTVEAGRPDTITQEKLDILRSFGVTRISVNPQTLSDAVLREIGRSHTTGQLLESYEMARFMGFSSINMDLIAGLPTDTREGFQATLDGVLGLEPENITVHTLTLKRAARLSYCEAEEARKLVQDMVDSARRILTGAGYVPYYLYRQNGSLSGLENVGYAKPGTESLYNVYIMDESHTVLAVGAGASTKLCHPLTHQIKRVYNYKYSYEYMKRFDEVILRKKGIESFLG